MKVYVTPRAAHSLDLILSYLKDKWGETVTREFLKKVDDFFALLSDYPLIGQTEYNDIRGFQLSKQTRVFYRVREDKIIILLFFDVRQNPNKKFK